MLQNILVIPCHTVSFIKKNATCQMSCFQEACLPKPPQVCTRTLVDETSITLERGPTIRKHFEFDNVDNVDDGGIVDGISNVADAVVYSLFK